MEYNIGLIVLLKQQFKQWSEVRSVLRAMYMVKGRVACAGVGNVVQRSGGDCSVMQFRVVEQECWGGGVQGRRRCVKYRGVQCRRSVVCRREGKGVLSMRECSVQGCVVQRSVFCGREVQERVCYSGVQGECSSLHKFSFVFMGTHFHIILKLLLKCYTVLCYLCILLHIFVFFSFRPACGIFYRR